MQVSFKTCHLIKPCREITAVVLGPGRTPVVSDLLTGLDAATNQKGMTVDAVGTSLVGHAKLLCMTFGEDNADVNLEVLTGRIVGWVGIDNEITLHIY